jgi:uncharacterized RDD family membrane protein YckC
VLFICYVEAVSSIKDDSTTKTEPYKVWNTDLDHVNTVKIAPIGYRLLALGIDFLTISFLYIAASFVWPRLLFNSDRSTGLLLFAILFIMRAALQANFGCTYGQKIFGIRIASAHGSMWQEAFLRNLVSYILLAIPLLGAINLIVAFARADSRGIHDLVGRTSVVKITQ